MECFFFQSLSLWLLMLWNKSPSNSVVWNNHFMRLTGSRVQKFRWSKMDSWTPQCLGLWLGVTWQPSTGASEGIFTYMSGGSHWPLAGTPTHGLSMCSLYTLVWASSQHGGWVPRIRQKHMAFLRSCLKSHSMTFIILCRSRQSQRSAQVLEEKT